MLPIKYTYLLGASLFLISWIFIYSARKDLRKVLLPVSLLFMVLGLISEYFWFTKDWWRPQTITNTIIGIEDVIFGFASGGAAACLYLFLFRKKLVENTKANIKRRTLALGWIVIFNLALFALLFDLEIGSFLSSIIVMISTSGMLLIQKRELIIPALISGALMLILVIPIYLLITFVTPDFIGKSWFLNNLLGTYFLKVPIEDYIFYYFFGALCFSVYPFCTDSKLSRNG